MWLLLGLVLAQPAPIEFTSVFTVRGEVHVKGYGPAVRAHVTACGAAGWTDSGGKFSLGGSVKAGGYLGCQVAIQLPGTRPAQVPIAAPAGSIDLGRIELEPLADGVAAGAVSFLALQAPPAAQKLKQQARQKLEKQDAQGAQKDLERALKLYESDPEAWVGMGLARARQGDAPGARDYFAKASALDNRFTPPYVELARLALEEKNWTVAAQHCETALAINPLGLPLAHLFLAMARLNQADYAGAASAARTAISVNGPPKAHHVLGVALVKLGQEEEGLAAMDEFLKLAPGAPEAELVRRQLQALRAR